MSGNPRVYRTDYLRPSKIHQIPFDPICILRVFSRSSINLPDHCFYDPLSGQFAVTSDKKRQHLLLYLVAVGSAISVAYVYPTPVTYSLFDTFTTDLSPALYDLIAIPLSLLFTGLVIFFMRGRSSTSFDTPDRIGVTQLTFIIERSIYIDNAYNIRAYNEAAFRCRLYQLPHRSSM